MAGKPVHFEVPAKDTSRAREFYSREIPAAVRRMITILQPVLIALIGGVILTVALAIILPILNIYNSIGHR